MKSIESYNIKKGDWIHYNSWLCSTACSIGYLQQNSMVDKQINELVQSFFNQWQFIISSYEKIYNLQMVLNSHSDEATGKNILSPYLVNSVALEMDFKNYSYLLITAMSTYLDLFSCIVDVAQNQTVREESKLTDFNKFGKRNENEIVAIKEEFTRLRDPSNYPWITLLKDVRNRIIHRGYTLKALFETKKLNELNMVVYKGINLYTDTISIEIGKLFNDFMVDMPSIDEKISDILIDKIDGLNKKMSLNVSFKYCELLSEYSYNEIEPIV